MTRLAKLADIIIRFRLFFIIVAVLVIAFSAYHIKDIKMDNDFLNFLPQKDKDVIIFKDIGKKFGSNYMAMVIFEADDIFATKELKIIRKLTKKYESFDGIVKVNSITNILDIKKIEGGIEVGKLINQQKIPTDPKKLRKLRDYTLSKEMYTDSFISKDGKTTTIVCRFRPESKKEIVAEELVKVTKEITGKKYRVNYAGFPIAMYFTNLNVLRDMSVLIPIIMILVILTLYLSFRSKTGVILPLLPVLVSTVTTVGLMSLFGFPITMISAIIPVILISCGTAYGIHMINKYKGEIEQGKNGLETIRNSIKIVGTPIILSGLTTFIGFISLLTSTLTIFKDFGLFTAIGIVFALLFAILIIPAILAYTVHKTKKIRSMEIHNRFLGKYAETVFRHKKPIIILTLIIAIFCIISIFDIKTEVNMLSYFEEDSPVRIAENIMQEHFGGSTPVGVITKGDLKNPYVLKQLARLEKKMKLIPHINHPQGVSDLILEMNDVMNDRRSIPGTSEGVANLWLFIDGNDILPQMINPKRTEGLIQAVIDEIATETIANSVKKVHEVIEETPKETVVVNYETENKKTREKIINLKLEEIISDIKMDIEYKKLRVKDYAKLRNTLLDYMNNEKLPLDEIKHNIKDNIIRYLKSESADIEINNENIIREIAARLSNIQPGNTKTVYSITKPLLLGVDFDEEDLSYASEFMLTIIDRSKKDVLVKKLFNIVKEQVDNPKEFINDDNLTGSIIGDLWSINENYHILPMFDYVRIFNKEPDKNNIVKLELRQTGMGLILNNINDELLKSQLRAFLFAILLVFIVLMIQLKSILGGLLAIVPIIFTVAVNFGIMWLFNIPLDNATAMISSVAIGIGIDYTIHISSRLKIEYRKFNDIMKTFTETLQTTGRAVVINTVTVALGFLVLIFSSMEPLQRFGYLTFITMFVSAIGAMTIFPVLVILTKAKFIFSNTNNNLDGE